MRQILPRNPVSGHAGASHIDSFDGNAELINDGPMTAPSKRVLAIVPEYRKVRDGVSILEGELVGALASTPRFASWVDRIVGND